MAKNVVVAGTQWGMRGKGKIVDWLTDQAQGVVRFRGAQCRPYLGWWGRPSTSSTSFHRASAGRAQCYIGNGVVLDIHHLLAGSPRPAQRAASGPRASHGSVRAVHHSGLSLGS